MLPLFFSIFGEFQALPLSGNMNYSILNRFQWIRLDANILETMPRNTREKKDCFGTYGHGLKNTRTHPLGACQCLLAYS